ncbi:MAG: hypothetical protein K6T83_10750 [Alicyclobacillus sp.]|nr:hypothetical protein [Alicyclobacillus sp.]
MPPTALNQMSPLPDPNTSAGTSIRSSVSRPVRNCAKENVPRHEWCTMFFAVLTGTVALWMVVTKSATIERLNGEIDQLQAKLATIQRVNASLAAQEQALVQPTQVLQTAANKFHMKISEPIRILIH